MSKTKVLALHVAPPPILTPSLSLCLLSFSLFCFFFSSFFVLSFFSSFFSGMGSPPSCATDQEQPDGGCRARGGKSSASESSSVGIKFTFYKLNDVTTLCIYLTFFLIFFRKLALFLRY